MDRSVGTDFHKIEAFHISQDLSDILAQDHLKFGVARKNKFQANSNKN